MWLLALGHRMSRSVPSAVRWPPPRVAISQRTCHCQSPSWRRLVAERPAPGPGQPHLDPPPCLVQSASRVGRLLQAIPMLSVRETLLENYLERAVGLVTSPPSVASVLGCLMARPE